MPHTTLGTVNSRGMTHAFETVYKSMFPKRSLALPMALGIAMICLLIVVIVGWILVTVRGVLRESDSTIYIVWLIVGTVFLCSILAGVAFYLSVVINSVRINQRQANFIDAVTHELKSPIAALRLGLETMSRRQLSQEDTGKFTRAMKKDILRLDRLISHLLDAAGLNVANDQPVREVLDLKAIIQDCVSDVCTYHDFPEKQIDCQVEPILSVGFSQDFEIILRNLIDNAVKYSGNPPQVSIRTRSKKDRGVELMIIEIENNGASVPENEKKRVFKRFERVEIELERTKPGVGLGLYIVQLLVRRNNGSIRLETPRSGSGTKVVVELPIRKNDSSEFAEDGNNSPSDQVGSPSGPSTPSSDLTVVETQ